MDHQEVTVRQLDRDNLERNAVLIGAQEQDEIVLFAVRVGRVRRAGAGPHDVPRAIVADPMFRGRRVEADRVVTLTLCQTQLRRQGQ